MIFDGEKKESLKLPPSMRQMWEKVALRGGKTVWEWIKSERVSTSKVSTPDHFVARGDTVSPFMQGRCNDIAKIRKDMLSLGGLLSKEGE